MPIKKTYGEQLKHPSWQRKRLEVLQAADFKCELCSEAEKTLHVHHKRYVKGREVWEYDLRELQCLCEDCHAEHHELHGLLEEVLAQADHFDPYRVSLGLVAGYLAACYSIDQELEQRVRAKVGRSMDIGMIALQLATANRNELREFLIRLNGGLGQDPALALLLDRLADDAPDRSDAE